MAVLSHRGRPLRLGFCTNVLPADGADGILDGLEEVFTPVRDQIAAEGAGSSFGLGLWLPAAVALELDGDEGRARAFHERMDSLGLSVFTLNGFPYGDFHGERVKDEVFRPAWNEPERLGYTLALGRLLARWIGEGDTGSISTHTGGHKSWGLTSDLADACAAQFLELAVAWDRLADDTGRELVLGLEMEPRSALESTDELISFYEDRLLARAAVGRLVGLGVSRGRAEEVIRRHVGVCYDSCHQAVEFEPAADSLDRLQGAGIRIAKLQITNALVVEQPLGDSERLERLAQFAEPRYLHQVACRDRSGRVVIHDDLEQLLEELPQPWRDASSWRIHFHVPVHAPTVSGFDTTRDELLKGLEKVLEDDLTRHLEVETYTWGVMPEKLHLGSDLSDRIGREMSWTLEQIRRFDPSAR